MSNDKYKEKFLEVLHEESVKSVKENMASISIKIPKEFIDKPGFYYAIAKILTMGENKATHYMRAKVRSKYSPAIHFQIVENGSMM